MKALLAAFALLLAPSALAADVQVIVYQVELSQARISALLAEGLPDPELFKKVRDMVAAKSAKLRDISLIRVKSGWKGAIESNREVIYPAEDEPGGLGKRPLSPEEQKKLQEKWLRQAAAARFLPIFADWRNDFETRNVGLTLEVDSGPTQGVRWNIEQVDYARDTIMGQTLGLDGKPRIQRMPTFDSLRLSGNPTAAKGVSFAGALTPVEPDGSLARDRKILVFVKADLLGNQ